MNTHTLLINVLGYYNRQSHRALLTNNFQGLVYWNDKALAVSALAKEVAA